MSASSVLFGTTHDSFALHSHASPALSATTLASVPFASVSSASTSAPLAAAATSVSASDSASASVPASASASPSSSRATRPPPTASEVHAAERVLAERTVSHLLAEVLTTPGAIQRLRDQQARDARDTLNEYVYSYFVVFFFV